MRDRLRVIGLAWLLLTSSREGHAQGVVPSAAETGSRVVRVVVLGDSITKGVRPGVRVDETFARVVEKSLRRDGINVEVMNLGVGGERTDQALKRLASVTERQPQVVTVMYGTNDSYVDKGAKSTRITVEAYRSNLRAIVAELLLHGIEPILMTEPRWADDAPPNGLNENPNTRLEPFMQACRAVALECGVPLVDHFAQWTTARSDGQLLGDWTTDGCHPNPQGHRKLAELLLPALRDAFRPPPVPVPVTTRLETALTHDDGRFLWYHPRAVALPKPDRATPDALITLQKHLKTSDHYSGLNIMTSADLGQSWSGPNAVPELDWVHEPEDVDVAVADVTPLYHAPTGKVLAVGAQVRYSAQGKQLEDRPRSNQTAYAVLDPKTGRWTPWRRLELPQEEIFQFARSACAQGAVERDGSVLLPFYIAKSADVPYMTTVARCDFDGNALTYRTHGDILALNVARGLYEPSLVHVGPRYYLTIRNDVKGYVTAGNDGLHYRPVKPWRFGSGEELGSYNTQQHWLSHGDNLFLVYTRRGAGNDHIPRHRAPLFLAQVDPNRLEVIRATERVLVPERGAELGNFGASAMTDQESWVTVSEGVWSDEARRRGATGATFVARVVWSKPSTTPTLAKTQAALEAGQAIRVVCFGDSVTGVYYHTGSRRAYTDMLEIALRRTYPRAGVQAINAGISGNTTRDALARIERDVLNHRPTLVTVMFGLNDMTRVPLDEYQANLAQIVAKCRAIGAEVLLCTPNNVITTAGRPSERLNQYCDAIREQARKLEVPLCDVNSELEKLRTRDAAGWRLLMSDEIHPNMDGHKRIAELLNRAITGREIDLSNVPPPSPALPRTGKRLAGVEPLRVLAMPPLDAWIGPAIQAEIPSAKVEVTPWPIAGKSLAELEKDARERVRKMAPDLVLVAVPRESTASSLESFIHDQIWIVNSSLSFGPDGWDCVVVHPSVIGPDPNAADSRDDLVRRLVQAQDLPLIERPNDDTRSAQDLFRAWIARRPWQPE